MSIVEKREVIKLLSKYVNFDDEQVTGQVVYLLGGVAQVVFNWQELELWRQATGLNKSLFKTHVWPIFEYKFYRYDELHRLVSDVPKYLREGVALTPKSGIIQSIQRDNQPRINPQTPTAKSSFASSTPLRERSGLSQEIEIMAKTAVFDSENVLVDIYESKKEARAHNKGTDLKFIDAKSFPKGGIGEYATVETLFPAKEKPAKPEGEKTRTVVKREGTYRVVKADGARFNDGDERGLLHTALMGSTSVEEYLGKAPKEAKFTSSRGAAQVVTAAGYMSYAFKRGWISQGEASDDQPEVVVEE
jgi:hypothetical protein